MQALRNISIIISILFIAVFLFFTIENSFYSNADSKEIKNTLLYGSIGILYFATILFILYKYKCTSKAKLVAWLSFIFSIIPLTFFFVIFWMMSQIEC